MSPSAVAKIAVSDPVRLIPTVVEAEPKAEPFQAIQVVMRSDSSDGKTRLVEAGAKDIDEKTMMKVADIQRLRDSRTIAMVGRRGGSRKIQVQRIDLPILYSFTTTAGATYTTPIAINPFDSSEYSSLAALYDEIIIDGASMMFTTAVSVGYTAQTTQIGVWAYDPITSTALGSLVNGLQHSQKHVWAHLGNATYNPTEFTRDGLRHFKWKTLPGSARSVTNTNVFGHDWTSTTETTAVYGYLKPYINPPGATGKHDFVVVVTLHARVRSRS